MRQHTRMPSYATVPVTWCSMCTAMPPTSPSSMNPTPNGPILNIAKILRNVLLSAAEAEWGALFVNAKEATSLRTTLIEMDHPQPATPLQTDNSTDNGIVNGTVKQQQSKAIDMRFYWIRDHSDQGQFHIYWAPGSKNLGDYFTKHHLPKHHWLMRPVFLHTKQSPATRFQQGCVDSPNQSNPEVTRRIVRPAIRQLDLDHKACTRCKDNKLQPSNDRLINYYRHG